MTGYKTAFTKENSTALKGVAIIMMVFHHCYSLPERYAGRAISFAPFGEHWVAIVSNSFKMCVSFYAFITGYGLYLSLKRLHSDNLWSRRDIAKWAADRYVKTMSGFWIIVVLSYIICQIIDGRTYTVFFADTTIEQTVTGISKMMLNFFGLGKLFDVNVFCGTWWYMSLAVLFIVAAPVFVKAFDRFGVLPVLVVAFFIPRVFRVPYDASTYISFQFAFLFGIIFAKYNLLVRFANVKWIKSERFSKLNKPVKFVSMTVLCWFLLYLYHCLMAKRFYEIRFGLIPMVMIIYAYEFFLDAVMFRKVLCFLGRHSMNIFLTHTFIRAIYLNDFIYSFDYWWEPPIVLFVMSLFLSIAIEIFKKLIRYDLLVKKMLKGTSVLVEKVYDFIPLSV